MTFETDIEGMTVRVHVEHGTGRYSVRVVGRALPKAGKERR